jgi:hypothetical protein
VPDVSEDAEFKVVELLVDGGAEGMAKALQEAADDGFEWVHAIDRERIVFAVMKRPKHGPVKVH